MTRSIQVNSALLLLLVGAMSVSGSGARSAALPSDSEWPVFPGEFGLAHGLRWGMSVADIRADLPDLAVAPDLPNNFLVVDDPKLAHTATAKGLWLGCPLNYALRFFNNRLDDVRISTGSAESCRPQAESTLFLRYHETNLPLACPNIVHRRWKDANTDATYDYDCDALNAGSSQSANSDFQLHLHQTSDRSGRDADRPRWSKCRSFITVEFISGQYADGASTPAMSPDSPDLGCNPEAYGALSARLMEYGILTLNVSLSETGEVREAEILSRTRYKRVDDAALALVRDKLRFIPAHKDGMPVAVTRQLEVGFRLANQTFAIGDVGYACSLPGADPCNGAPLAIDLAPARAGAVLDVSSPDIRPGEPVAPAISIGAKSPALIWTAGPSGTQSYALVAEHRQIVGTSEHWIMYDIPADAVSLPAGIPNDARVPNPPRAMNAGRVRGFPGFAGIPARIPTHIQIFALDTKLGLDPITVNRAALIAAIKGHVLASGELVAGVANR